MDTVLFRTHFWYTQANGDAISAMARVNRHINRLEATIKVNLSTTNIMDEVLLNNQILSTQESSRMEFTMVMASLSSVMVRPLLENFELDKSSKESM